MTETMPPSIGPQTESRKRNAPKISFGVRPKEKKRPADNVPFYTPEPSIGKQVSSTRRNVGGATFGTAPREPPRKIDSGATGEGTFKALESVGPQQLSTRKTQPSFSIVGRWKERKREAVGKSIQSKWKTAPGATFGSAKRTVSTPSAKSEVGPGSHAAPSSFGRQLVSGRSSPRGGTFGKAARHPAPPKKVKVGTQAAPSSVGPQVLSRWSSPPSATFGVSKRPELPSDLPQDIPGPGDYVAPSSFGEQTASQRPNSPRVSMGQKWKERPREEDTVPFYDVPGTLTTGANAPAARFGTATRELPVKKTYEITNTGKARAAEAFGSQVLSDRRNAPAVSFGSRPATKPPSPTGPDPGAYASPGALGRQIRSGRPSSAAFSFGTSRRPGDSGRANARSKVGPGLYKPPPSVGAQVLSGRKNAAAISFGVRWREPKPADEVPGPGAYAAPSSLGGPRSTFGTATREAALAAATGRRPLPQRPTTAASTRKRRSPRQRPGTAGARVSKQRDASGSTQREPTGTSAAA